MVTTFPTIFPLMYGARLKDHEVLKISRSIAHTWWATLISVSRPPSCKGTCGQMIPVCNPCSCAVNALTDVMSIGSNLVSARLLQTRSRKTSQAAMPRSSPHTNCVTGESDLSSAQITMCVHSITQLHNTIRTSVDAPR